MIGFWNPLKLIVCTFVLVGLGAFGDAQDTSGKKAVMVFQLDMKGFLNSKTIETLGGKEEYFKAMDMDSEGAEVIQKLDRADFYVAAPEGGLDPETLMSTDFLAVLRMSDKEIAEKMEGELSGGFVDDEIDGKKVLRAEGPGAPPVFARRDGNVLMFASKRFLFTKPESLVGKDLDPLLKDLGKSHVKMVANFDGARDFLDAAADMANENADFMSRQYISLLNQIATLQMSYDVDGEKMFYARMTGHNEDENRKIKLKMDAAFGLLKGFAELGLADLKKESEAAAKLGKVLIDSLSVASDKEATTVTLTRPKDFDKLLKAAFVDAKANQKRLQDTNRLRQVALAKHNYLDTHRKFPFDEEVTQNLSWRVNVLPYMEEQRLYEKFDHDKKWSDGANGKLVSERPEMFQFSNGATISFLKPDKVPKSFRDILDGTSLTIVFVENRKAKMVPWTKPEGVTPKEFISWVKDLEDGDSLLVAFYDGSVHRITNQCSRETLRKLCNPNDGEIVDYNDIK